MNQEQQPEALRLAAELVEPIDGFQEPTTLEAAAASELRRLHQHELAHIEWLEKTEWVQKSARPSELGKHRADVISARIAEKDAEICRLHARMQELEASQEHLKNALEDIASGEITRSHCVGPHCTEEVGLATADEMASRAAGTLHWHGITQEKQG